MFLTFMFADFAFSQLVVGVMFQVVLCTARIVAYICVMCFSTSRRERFCAREFVAMHEFEMCGKQGTYACSTPGPARRDYTPGGNMCTAGLSHPVVKETHACEFARFPSR